MINKESYRQYLIGRMERKTPVLERIASNEVTTPIQSETKPLQRRRKWLIPAISAFSVLAIALGVTAFALTHPTTNPENWIMSLEERQYLAARVYDETVGKDESIQYAALPDGWPKRGHYSTTPQTNTIWFTKLEVRDSFYIKTTFESDFAPFFGEGFANAPIDTVVALLHYEYPGSTKEEKKSSVIIMTIFCQNGTANGFVGTGQTEEYPPMSLSPFTWFGVSSNLFLTANSIVEDNTDQSINYQVLFKKEKETVYSISARSGWVSYKEPVKDIPCSVDNSAYKPLAKDVTLDLVNGSAYSEKVYGSATVEKVNDDGSLSVSSLSLPTLKTLHYTHLSYEGESTIGDSRGLLKEGSKLSFFFYSRSVNYAPVDLTVGTIELA